MLNLKIAMMPLAFISSLLLGVQLLLLPVSSPGEALISYPENGDVVEGIVEIRGSVPAEEFASARVSYSYIGSEENWFLIAMIDQPVEEGVLAAWDTSTITDGMYQLRLVVKTTAGTKSEVIVSDIQVANYTQTATQPDESDEKIDAQAEPGETITVPTPIPINPAAISDKEINRAMLVGGLSGIAAVLVLIFIYYLRMNLNRK